MIFPLRPTEQVPDSLRLRHINIHIILCIVFLSSSNFLYFRPFKCELQCPIKYRPANRPPKGGPPPLFLSGKLASALFRLFGLCWSEFCVVCEGEGLARKLLVIIGNSQSSTFSTKYIVGASSQCKNNVNKW